MTNNTNTKNWEDEYEDFIDEWAIFTNDPKEQEYRKMVKQFIKALIESEKKKARQELYEAFDKKYKDFELTIALWKWQFRFYFD